MPHTAPHIGARLLRASVAHLDVNYLGLETASVPLFLRPTAPPPPTANRCGKRYLPAYQLTSPLEEVCGRGDSFWAVGLLELSAADGRLDARAQPGQGQHRLRRGRPGAGGDAGPHEEENSDFLLAKRQHKAKMQRFGSDSVDRGKRRGKASPSGQLERYYKAQLELAKAQIMHESCHQMVVEAQIKAKDALLQVQATEIARLRRLVVVPNASP